MEAPTLRHPITAKTLITCTESKFSKKIGSSALFDNMLLVNFIENDKIDAYFRAG